jgi:hypothetical protein
MNKLQLITTDESDGHGSFKIKIILKNISKEDIKLVRAGDGSIYDQRTPRIGWNIESVPKNKFHYWPPKAQCGTINPLREDEFFTLKKEEELDISGWYPRPRLPDGKYKITAFFHNDLDRPYGFGKLETMKGKFADLLRTTHPCNLTSNELLITIKRVTVK